MCVYILTREYHVYAELTEAGNFIPQQKQSSYPSHRPHLLQHATYKTLLTYCVQGCVCVYCVAPAPYPLPSWLLAVPFFGSPSHPSSCRPPERQLSHLLTTLLACNCGPQDVVSNSAAAGEPRKFWYEKKVEESGGANEKKKNETHFKYFWPRSMFSWGELSSSVPVPH